MNYEKFTLKLQSAIESAVKLAENNQHTEVTPAHILIALTEDREGVLYPLFQKLGVSPERVIAEMEAIISRLPKAYGDSQRTFSRSAARILNASEKVASDFKDEYISSAFINAREYVGWRKTACRNCQSSDPSP